MREYIKSVVVLTCVCLVIAAGLGVVNYFTAPVIEAAQNAAANEALLVVYPDGKGFKELDLSTYTLPSTVVGAWSEESGGYVIKLETTGFDKGMVIMCGVDAQGKVLGATCITSKETLGKEKVYGDSLVGATLDTIAGVDTIAGATMTTSAYKNAVKDAINASIILGGGDVDIRDEAQILADNLAAALPAGNGAFTKLFLYEVVENISAVYTADNGEGSVYVTSEGIFVGVDKTGAVVGEVDATASAIALAADAILTASTLTEIDLTDYRTQGVSSSVLKAYISTNGNYVFEMRASGFGIEGEWHPSGEYIYFTISMTAEGKIISCLTTKQAESAGMGVACAKEEFYGQFSGLGKEDLDNIDGISGATITTDGYVIGIRRAFNALTILKGENQ